MTLTTEFLPSKYLPYVNKLNAYYPYLDDNRIASVAYNDGSRIFYSDYLYDRPGWIKAGEELGELSIQINWQIDYIARFGYVSTPWKHTPRSDIITGTQYNDTISAIDDFHYISKSYGDPAITKNSEYYDFFYGMGGNDQIFGKWGQFSGGDGNDTVYGWGVLYGDKNNDTLISIQTIDGKPFDSKLYGGDGNDNLSGRGTLNGGNDNDSIRGTGTLLGGDGNDDISGTGTLIGGDGNDTLSSASYYLPETDTIQYSIATMDGGDGNDVFFGRGTFYSGDGNDTLNSVAWQTDTTLDILTGGTGSDTFAVNNKDQITDFDSADVIRYYTDGHYGNQTPTDLFAIASKEKNGTVFASLLKSEGETSLDYIVRFNKMINDPQGILLLGDYQRDAFRATADAPQYGNIVNITYNQSTSPWQGFAEKWKAEKLKTVIESLNDDAREFLEGKGLIKILSTAKLLDDKGNINWAAVAEDLKEKAIDKIGDIIEKNNKPLVSAPLLSVMVELGKTMTKHVTGDFKSLTNAEITAEYTRALAASIPFSSTIIDVTNAFVGGFVDLYSDYQSQMILDTFGNAELIKIDIKKNLETNGNDLHIQPPDTNTDPKLPITLPKLGISEGTDTVYSKVSIAPLPDGLENITLQGDQDLTATGNDGINVIIGNDGNNRLEAWKGNDTIDGGLGNDTILAGSGNDSASGGEGNDSLDGGNGNDLLIGGENGDTLTGGIGNDIFVVLSRVYSTNSLNGMDVITDFTKGEDKIDVTGMNYTGLNNSEEAINIRYDAQDNRTYLTDNTTTFKIALDGDHSNLTEENFIGFITPPVQEPINQITGTTKKQIQSLAVLRMIVLRG
jgi:Ca2+-binding RTX toxin-like protein